MNDDSSEQRTTAAAGGAQAPPLRWLLAGALAGLALAAYGLVDSGAAGESLPAGAVARIGERVITSAGLDRAVRRLEDAAGRQLAADERDRVLKQMIEEELLVQRGIELGMTESEATVRTAIAQSLIASVTAEADAADPDDETLRRFLEAHAERYTFASATTLEAWVTDDEAAAREFLARLAAGRPGDPPPALRPVAGLPADPLPLARLRMFVGPAIAEAAAEMPVGESGVFARQGRWYVVRVAERRESMLADLDSVRSQVLVDYRQSLADAELEAYLQRLRDRTRVTRAAAP